MFHSDNHAFYCLIVHGEYLIIDVQYSPYWSNSKQLGLVCMLLPHWKLMFLVTWALFNIKMSSYQYSKSHCGDKTILRPSHLHNGISYTGKMSSLYWIRALDVKWPPLWKGCDESQVIHSRQSICWKQKQYWYFMVLSSCIIAIF